MRKHFTLVKIAELNFPQQKLDYIVKFVNQTWTNQVASRRETDDNHIFSDITIHV